jgi:hypothetical protein
MRLYFNASDVFDSSCLGIRAMVAGAWTTARIDDEFPPSSAGKGLVQDGLKGRTEQRPG